jgi:gamma-glutamylputrescine oxidase
MDLERPDGLVPSYYAASANSDLAFAEIEGDIVADICIIGAGFTGLSAAMELSERGYDVVVLEGARVGWGASGRNGGQLVNGYSRPLDVIGKRYGPDTERAMGEMALEGAAIIRERTANYNIACDLVDGNLITALTQKQMRDLENKIAVWKRHGHNDVAIVDRNELSTLVSTERYVGGLLDKRGGHFHPLNFLLGEAAELRSRGTRIYEGSRMLHLGREAGRPTAITKSGKVTANMILLCGNAYLDDAAPSVSRRIMPVSSQVITTEPLGELAEELIPSNYCVEDASFILDYFRRTADGRILYGGGTVYGGRDPDSILAKIRPLMLRTFPELKRARIEYAWSGQFALTLTRVPQIGHLAPDILFSHGDSGHGVTTTQLLGRLLAEAAAHQTERFDVIAKLPHYAFPGGRQLRVPLTRLGAWYYTLRDKLGV